jgi:integrase
LGLRKEEGLSLRYDRDARGQKTVQNEADNFVDRAAGVFVFRRHKTWRKKGTKFIPISNEIATLLDRIAESRKTSSPYLFPSDYHGERRKHPWIANVDNTWDRLKQTAGIEQAGLHDLRRSIVTFSVEEAGVALESICKVLGHSEKVSRERYHVVLAQKAREHMQTTTSALARVLSGQPPKLALAA